MLNSGNVYKYLDSCANGFWSAKRCLTYNKPIICVTGTRSVGKSTGVAVFCLVDFMQNLLKSMAKKMFIDNIEMKKDTHLIAIFMLNRKTYLLK